MTPWLNDPEGDMENVVPFPRRLEEGECEMLALGGEGAGWKCDGCGLFKPRVRGPFFGAKLCDECREAGVSRERSNPK